MCFGYLTQEGVEFPSEVGSLVVGSHGERCNLVSALGEEIGELFKAVRNTEDLAIDAASPVNEVADELADVMIMLIAVANHSGINLEAAFREKEEKNKTRSWA